jgi:uncharacterized protein (DUF1800 family)
LLATAEIKPLASWWMALILGGGAPLRERMTLAWHDHFATSFDKVADVRMMHAQNQLLRTHALGDFRELLHGIAKDPAMLVWLDGDDNRKGHPNENFAREVLELFALGIGNYGEDDVREAARAFTGWGTNGRSFVHVDKHHDDGTKTIFGKSGRFDGDDAIDLVLARRECPRWIARRLLVELVMPDPPRAAIDETAAILVDANWNVRATVERILASRLFFSPEARRARIAGPVELIARSARTLNARVSPERAAEAAAEMGQALFRPPSVKGWDGQRTWIHAGSWIARHNWLAALAIPAQPKDETVRVDLERALGAPASTDEAADRVLRALLPDACDATFREKLSAAARACETPSEALGLCAALALTSPEYQRI